MARTVNDILSVQVGNLIIQLATLAAENEMLKEMLAQRASVLDPHKTQDVDRTLPEGILTQEPIAVNGKETLR